MTHTHMRAEHILQILNSILLLSNKYPILIVSHQSTSCFVEIIKKFQLAQVKFLSDAGLIEQLCVNETLNGKKGLPDVNQ